MTTPTTQLTPEEITWLRERRVSRLSDNKEVQIYPMGAERYLASALLKPKKNHYPLSTTIIDKTILVIPGHGNSSFLFAQSGARSVTVYDKDPVTIAWMKAFKKYYHYREFSPTQRQAAPTIGELFAALNAWYPPLLSLPEHRWINAIAWLLNPNQLRRIYIHYLLDLVQQALRSETHDAFELNHDIQFHTGTIDKLLTQKMTPRFDTIFVPYLLGVKHGIEAEADIVGFIHQLAPLAPHGHLLVTPSRHSKDFYLIGKRYFITTPYPSLSSLPGLSPYVAGEDPSWFRRQGLAIFSTPNTQPSKQPHE